jgi:hypothetical protein
VANLGGEPLDKVARPAGEVIFAQGASVDERKRTMRLDTWAIVWCLRSPDG